MVLPAGLPGYELYDQNDQSTPEKIDIGASLVLVMQSLQLQLRSHPYYMGRRSFHNKNHKAHHYIEMSLSMDTIYGHCQEHVSEQLLLHPASRITQREDLVIDGSHA